MGSLTNYMENKLADWRYRGQSYTPPATVWIGFLTAAPSDSAAGTEVTGGSYARAGVSADLTNWSGTQGASTTAVSNGTSGTISNNADIAFATPTADWGTVLYMGIWDAATAGNLTDYCALTNAKIISAGDDVKILAGALTIQVDN